MYTAKKQTTLHGQVILPLRVGTSAHISYNGESIRTSMVVTILEISELQIVFETHNTVYCVIMDATRQDATHQD